MNKEQLRKELEDCWDAAVGRVEFNSEKYARLGNAGPFPLTREEYITTRLAALDDGDGEEVSLTWGDVYIVKAGRLLTTWDGETVDLWVTGIMEEKIPLWGNESNKIAGIYLTKPKGDSVHCLSFITPKIQSAIQVIIPKPIKWDGNNRCLRKQNGGEQCAELCEGCFQLYKHEQPLDDGREGKGLPNFLVIKDSDDHYFIWPRNRYEKYVSEAVEVGATPAVKIVVGFNGDEDFLFPKPLPLADGEGEKVGNAGMIDFLNFCSGKFTPDDADETWTDNDGERYTPKELLDIYFQWDKRKPLLPSAVTGGGEGLVG